MSLYQLTNSFGTDSIYNYFDLNSNSSISASFGETSTDNTKLRSNASLNSNLKHAGSIRYLINSSDLASNYVPKCYYYSGAQTAISLSVPTITNRIVYLLQAPGAYGSRGSTSPDNNGGDGGSGALSWGYISRNLNRVSNISITISAIPGIGSGNVASTIAFTGATSITLTCNSGSSSGNTNVGGSGGTVSYSSEVGVSILNSYNGTNGTNSSRDFTSSPYMTYFKSTATTAYYPLLDGDYGRGGRGGGYGNNGDAGNAGIAAIWFLI
jgi:hypothetical protein